MKNDSVMTRIKDLVGDAGVGVFTTVDEMGKPHSRWMTPIFLPRLPGALYAVTSRDFKKTGHLASNPNVSWIFQSKSLDRVATVSGKATIVHDPSLAAEVLEAIGPHLQVFWKFAGDPKKLVVMETVIESVSWFSPMGEGKIEEAVHE
jgi:pyridoxamine 5'-phosphate oxidase